MHRLFVLLAGLVVVVVAGWWSGREPRLDAFRAAAEELGIQLEYQYSPLGDVTLYSVQAGPPDGPPVVLLHGFPEFWYAWKDVIPLLAEAGFRVIVPDQRGYGESDKPREVAAYDVDRLADDIATLIVHLGHESAHVAAHDWGGAVAWNLAIRHPEHVRRLAVIDTPHPDAGRVPSLQEDTVNWFRMYFQIPWLPEWSARIGHWWLLSKTMRDSAAPGTFPEEKLALYRSAWDRDGAIGTMMNWYRAEARKPSPTGPLDTRRVAAPTLLILAPDDAFIPGGLTRASLQFLDDGRLVELDEGTHWVIQERPGEIAALLAEFFAE